MRTISYWRIWFLLTIWSFHHVLPAEDRGIVWLYKVMWPSSNHHPTINHHPSLSTTNSPPWPYAQRSLVEAGPACAKLAMFRSKAVMASVSCDNWGMSVVAQLGQPELFIQPATPAIQHCCLTNTAPGKDRNDQGHWLERSVVCDLNRRPQNSTRVLCVFQDFARLTCSTYLGTKLLQIRECKAPRSSEHERTIIHIY